MLPSPPFALLIRNGNVETFVIDINKRPVEKAEVRLLKSFRGQEVCRFHSLEKMSKVLGSPLVVVDEEPLHDENVDPLLLRAGFLGFR